MCSGGEECVVKVTYRCGEECVVKVRSVHK